MNRNMQSRFQKFLAYLTLGLGAVVILLPFFWMLVTAVKPSNEVLLMPPTWFPSRWEWHNFIEAYQAAPFRQYLSNSIFVSFAITAGDLLTTIFASYAFAYLPFKGKNLIFTALVATMMVPSEILIIPNFVTLSQVGWIDTYQALILPWCASVFNIFLLRQRFLSIDRRYFQAAKVDGASDMQFLFQILTPMSIPTLASIAVLKIIASWNAYMWPLIVTNSNEMRTLPLALAAFSNETGTKYNTLMAFSLMVLLPVLVTYFLVQKHIIAGISDGGLKG